MYIGQSKHIEKRWNNHKYKLRKGIHYAPNLQKAWNKYGEDMFKLLVIEQCEENLLHKRELYWIKLLEPYKPSKGYNRHWKQAQKDKEKWQ